MRASSREREGSNVQASGECEIGDSPPLKPHPYPAGFEVSVRKNLVGWTYGLGFEPAGKFVPGSAVGRVQGRLNFSASTLTCPFKMALGRMRWEANEDFWGLSYSMAKQLSQPTPKFTKPLGNLGALVMAFEVGPAVAVWAYPYKATERGPRHQRMAKDRGRWGGLEATLGEEGQTGVPRNMAVGPCTSYLSPMDL